MLFKILDGVKWVRGSGYISCGVQGVRCLYLQMLGSGEVVIQNLDDGSKSQPARLAFK